MIFIPKSVYEIQRTYKRDREEKSVKVEKYLKTSLHFEMNSMLTETAAKRLISM